jgi:hypothetical protein
MFPLFKKNNTVIASFTFDGDGKRVKSVMGSETIVFVGGYYEIKNPGSGQEVTKYYFAGASRIAMRKYIIPQSMSVEYLLGDHLGSNSITTDANGGRSLKCVISLGARLAIRGQQTLRPRLHTNYPITPLQDNIRTWTIPPRAG